MGTVLFFCVALFVYFRIFVLRPKTLLLKLQKSCWTGKSDTHISSLISRWMFSRGFQIKQLTASQKMTKKNEKSVVVIRKAVMHKVDPL